MLSIGLKILHLAVWQIGTHGTSMITATHLVYTKQFKHKQKCAQVYFKITINNTLTFRFNIHSCQACNVRLCEPITLKTTCTLSKFKFRKYTRREEERLASLRQPFDMFKHKKGTLSRMRVGGMAYDSRIYIYIYIYIYISMFMFQAWPPRWS